jgi:dipeptidyl aminopeptidase/acylaminoacyl peptidase
VSVSPDGTQFRATTLDEPFSYVQPVSSFGRTENVLDASGTVLVELSKRPLDEGADPDSQPVRPAGTGGRGAAADTGRRDVQWHPTEAGLLYAQMAPAPARAAGARRDSGAGAAPSGAPAAARRGDRLVHWLPPYDSTSRTVLYETTNRISASRFSDDGRMLFVSETGTGGTTEVAVILADPSKKYTLLAPSRAARDSAAAAGTPATPAFGRGRNSGPSLATKPGRRGASSVVVSDDGEFVYLEGTTPDSSAERSDRVWLDRVAIRTGERTRLYESDGTMTESIGTLLDDNGQRMIVNRESPTMPAQSFLVEIASRNARQLTSNTDLTPEVSSAIKRTVIAKRADGFTFKVNVTLPADYKEGTRLPAMFWFYPREYDDQEAYDRSAAGPAGGTRRFPSFNPRSMAFLTTQGYAVIEPDAPIFAANGLPANDNYEADLRNDLAATIDALDTLAIIDRQRLAIGGHSYGAFSAVNAMVHTPYFKAGIAGDGNFNRTLTPNGFQSERRDLWQAKDTYLSMSPFFFADKLNGALLLYHSTDDQNVGTAPINSERLFHALQGLGKDVSLYMYPYEDHGPIARETVLDQWARWVAWLDKYVKGAGKPGKGPVTMEDAP